MERKQTLEMKMLAYLLAHKYELGLEICDNCACSSSANIFEIAKQLASVAKDYYGEEGVDGLQRDKD